MSRTIQGGGIGESTIIRIVDETSGQPEQAVEHDTAGISLWYRREGGLLVPITPAALAALDTAHTEGGIEHIDDGYYRLDLPDAAIAINASGVAVGGSVTGMVVIGSYHQIVDFVPATGPVIYVKRGTELVDFPFPMVDADGNLLPDLGDVSVSISIDGGSFGASDNSPATPNQLGWYKITFTTADLAGRTAAVMCEASGARALLFTIVTQN